MTRPTRQEIDQAALEMVRAGRFQVDEEGNIASVQRDGASVAIGHSGNPHQNIAVNLKLQGQVCRVQASRLAWAVHYREWPPAHMSVMMVNGDKRDFKRDNLALVPRGKEKTADKAFREMEE